MFPNSQAEPRNPKHRHHRRLSRHQNSTTDLSLFRLPHLLNQNLALELVMAQACVDCQALPSFVRIRL